jgi:hypothetical protein
LFEVGADAADRDLMDLTGAHVSGTYTNMIVQLARKSKGEAGVAELLVRAGQTERGALLGSDESWSSYDEFRRLLLAAEDLLGSDSLYLLPEVVRGRLDDLPKVRETLRALGSPAVFLSRLGNDIAETSRIEDGYTEQVDPTTWDIGRRLHDGFEPYDQLCRFNLATSTLLPTLYGCAGVTAEEVSCQRHGDPWCTARVSWVEGEEHQVEFLETSLAMAEKRLAVFQETLSDIAATDRLDEVLQRIVVRTAEALQVGGLVLQLEPLPWSTRLVYATGMSDEEARAHAATGLGDLVVPVRSVRREYGAHPHRRRPAHGASIDAHAGARLRPADGDCDRERAGGPRGAAPGAAVEGAARPLQPPDARALGS